MLKVISASRRIDLVAAYPEKMIALLTEKAPPEKVHSLVIWTKNPQNLIHPPPLAQKIKEYRNLYLHITITGMGGTILEKKVPLAPSILALLPDLVNIVHGPDHIRVRFDPIVHLRMPDGTDYTNLPRFESIAKSISKYGIENVSISWMQEYRKVLNHLERKGIYPIRISNQKWTEELNLLRSVSEKYGITLHGCCVPIMPRSRCIDGELLQKLHPENLPCSTRKAKGQRELCGCTESYDIGWYEPCLHGCIYCYANPLIED